MLRFLPFLYGCCLLAACGPNIIYEKETPIPDAAWTYADSLTFDFAIVDTAGIYNLFLDVTHGPDYAYQNLYTRLVTEFPDGRTLDQTLSLELADKTGRWNGNCGGTTCTARIALQEGAYFDLAGEYTLTVHQYMRKASLPGVQAVGLAVEKTEQTR